MNERTQNAVARLIVAINDRLSAHAARPDLYPKIKSILADYYDDLDALAELLLAPARSADLKSLVAATAPRVCANCGGEKPVGESCGCFDNGGE